MVVVSQSKESDNYHTTRKWENKKCRLKLSNEWQVSQVGECGEDTRELYTRPPN